MIYYSIIMLWSILFIYSFAEVFFINHTSEYKDQNKYTNAYIYIYIDWLIFWFIYLHLTYTKNNLCSPIHVPVACISCLLPCPFRWITGNQYTSFSAVYPDCFGYAAGFAQALVKGREVPVFPDPHMQALSIATILRDFHLLSIDDAKKEADEAIVTCPTVTVCC